MCLSPLAGHLSASLGGPTSRPGRGVGVRSAVACQAVWESDPMALVPAPLRAEGSVHTHATANCLNETWSHFTHRPVMDFHVRES